MNEQCLMLPEEAAAFLARCREDVNTQAIRRWVGALPAAVRGRLATQTQWTFGRFDTPDGRRCLVAHVAVIRQQLGLPHEQPDLTIASAFDSVADQLGLWTAVALVRDATDTLK